MHPHIAIADRVFVECVGGDLTIKVENNTESGEGIYSEPVENPDQTLDDAEIGYALLSPLVLLRIRPYRENRYRYLVYNERTRSVVRVDSIAEACIRLPEDHGLIFPKGVYLQNGEVRLFEEDTEGMVYLECIKSPNGEDFLYVFYHVEQGRHVLLQYNLITKSLANPVFCHGYSLYDDGRMVLFRAPDNEPRRVHPMQIWQTPFYAETHEVAAGGNPYLARIGNRDLVRATSEAYAVSRVITAGHWSLAQFEDLIRGCTTLLDRYHWLGDTEAFDLRSVVQEIRNAAVAAVDEFEKVERARANTLDRIAQAESEVHRAALDWDPEHYHEIDEFVSALLQIRTRRGQVISLRELRFADQARIDALDRSLAEHGENVARACAGFLLSDAALTPYHERTAEVAEAVPRATKVAEIKPLETRLQDLAEGLDTLTEVMNELQIEDATQTARIVDAVSEVYSELNRTRAVVAARRQELGKAEAQAEFAAQFRLLTQGIPHHVGLCRTPGDCEEYLTRTLVTIEELEGRFAEFDEFLDRLATKRDEAYSAFTGRRQVLEEEQKRRVTTLQNAAARILTGIRKRAEGFATADEVNAFFASDALVAKLRDTVTKLRELHESVAADDLEGQVKGTRDEVLRRLRDRTELFEGEDLIRFGEHRFSVNTQELLLTTVVRDGSMCFHLTGTEYYEPITDPGFLETRELWDRDVVSESPGVYRSEYLAYSLLQRVLDEGGSTSWDELERDAAAGSDGALLTRVREFAATRYEEGYERGVHDHDAARILSALVRLYSDCGLLRYHATARAMAMLYWQFHSDPEQRKRQRSRLHSYGALNRLFLEAGLDRSTVAELREDLRAFYAPLDLDLDPGLLGQAAEYLYFELQDEHELRFTVHTEAEALYESFVRFVSDRGLEPRLRDDLNGLGRDLRSLLRLVRDWVSAFLRTQAPAEAAHWTWEIVALLLTAESLTRDTDQASTRATITGLLGRHPRIQDQALTVDIDRFLLRLSAFAEREVPLFQRFMARRQEMIDERRDALRLESFQSRVMGGFVRNRLINEVYLPLIGANFAKQIGAAGSSRRTDLMGLLLLVSPPGYGKTTLMEYVANRLGMTFVKINGPAIGSRVTSLDPGEAPNATAAEELNRLNLALEMGNNVMLYLDDIQHLGAEFLQKFISLCDAQRKIEGVYRGRARTYDLRGRKVAVVMAGNPYTESGTLFRIPDMLANRADTYNLGDISETASDAFALSFVENAMTSNPILQRVENRGHDDVYAFIHALETGDMEGLELEHEYTREERDETLNVLRKLLRIRDVVLRVNTEYIRSAAQQDEYRTEPPFRLQGSYRNMNRMAEKVLPVMTDAEVHQVVLDHYRNEAQTLTSGAESNLLKFLSLLGALEPEQAERREHICTEFRRRQSLLGADADDPVGRVLAQLSSVGSGINGIGGALREGLAATAERLSTVSEPRLAELGTRLAALEHRLADQAESVVAGGHGTVPVLQAIRDQGAAIADLRHVLQQFLEGNITIELKR
jgi:hypothetical protein